MLNVLARGIGAGHAKTSPNHGRTGFSSTPVL